MARKMYMMYKRLYFDSDTDQWVKRKALHSDHMSKSCTVANFLQSCPTYTLASSLDYISLQMIFHVMN